MLPPDIQPGTTFWYASNSGHAIYQYEFDKLEVVACPCMEMDCVMTIQGAGLPHDRCFPTRREAVEFCVARLRQRADEMEGSLK